MCVRVYLSIFGEKALELVIMFIGCDVGILCVSTPGDVWITGNGFWLIQDDSLTLHELLRQTTSCYIFTFVLENDLALFYFTSVNLI